MLLAMCLCSLLVPVDDRLIRNTVLVVQRLQILNPMRRKEAQKLERETDLQYLGEGFHDPGILVAVHLYCVDERYFCLWVGTERFENLREFLNKSQRAALYSAMAGLTGEEFTNRDLLYDQPFVLIGTRTPLDGVYQTSPNALDEFRLRQRVFFLHPLNR